MMEAQNKNRLAAATLADKAALLNWMQTELEDQFNHINQVMGISPEQFIQIYQTTGEVRVVEVENGTAIALYQKQGFNTFRKIPELGYWVMRKDL
jgi:hypothetical protein